MNGIKLKNKYFVLRHGRSIPNEQGLIVASMKHGVLQEYGLAPTRMMQAGDAGRIFLTVGDSAVNSPPPQPGVLLTVPPCFAQKLQDENFSLGKVCIYASPFSRTRQTAEIVARVLDPQSRFLHVQVLDDLRERYFGPSFEFQCQDLCYKLWMSDLQDPLVGPDGGESVADVSKRLSNVIIEMEGLHQGCAILLVSHGDPLHILQAVVHAKSKEQQEPSICLLESLKRPLLSSIRIDSRSYAMTTGQIRELF